MEQVRTHRVYRAAGILTALLLAWCGAVAAAGMPAVQAGHEAKNNGEYAAAVQHYRAALREHPGNADMMMSLAAVLSYCHCTGEALRLYDEVLQINPGRSDALAGRARMLWWRNRPVSALKAFQRVLEAEPDNAEALRTIPMIRDVLAFSGAAVLKNIGEWEDENAYTGTVHPLQEYRIAQRVHDLAEVQAGMFLDYSEKKYINSGAGIDTVLDIGRLDQGYLRVAWFVPGAGVMRTFGAFAPLQRDWTAYGAVWEGTFKRPRLQLTWSLGGGYEYFYHWTDVGRDYGEAAVGVALGRWSLRAHARAGRVRANAVERMEPDGTIVAAWADNRFTLTRITVGYKVPYVKGLRIRTFHEYYDYDEYAPGYYSPDGRQVASAGVSYGGRWGRYSVALDGAAGYDDGGVLIDGSNAPGGIYTSGSLKAGVTVGGVTVGAGTDMFANLRYRSRVFQVYLER